MPIVNAIQPTLGGPSSDGFVAGVAADGTRFLYSTYIGGSSREVGNGIAADAAGNAYVTGDTASSDFPTVAAIQPVFGSRYGLPDGFVVKIAP